MANAKRKGRGDDLKQEEILQAVVIADSFNVRFGPATSKKPRVCKLKHRRSLAAKDTMLEF